MGMEKERDEPTGGVLEWGDYGRVVGEGRREGKEEGKALGSGEVGQQRIMISVYGRGSSGESCKQDFWRASGPQPRVPEGLHCHDQSMATLCIPDHHTVTFAGLCRSCPLDLGSEDLEECPHTPYFSFSALLYANDTK